MIIALTGTPGVGKSSVAETLKDKYEIINLVELAKRKKFILGYDRERDSYIIDIEKLENYIKGLERKKSVLILDGHLSHLFKNLDKVIVLRCNPEVLRKRLLKKGWNEKKIRENLEAEMLDVILGEAIDMHGSRKVFEVDTTYRSVEEVGDIVEGLIEGKIDYERYRPGKIDWSNYLMEGLDGA